ncbi:MAG: hypothetical protein ACRELV_06135 [Longimicrobiales bacterium]
MIENERSWIRRLRRPALACTALLVTAAPATGQEDRVPQGVRLGFIYQTGFRPKLAVRPIAGGAAAADVAATIHEILVRDLDYSDRFEMATTPASLAEGALNYAAWNDLGIVYLVTGEVEPAADGLSLRLTLHDVVYSRVRELGAFRLPPARDDGFRMAVHAASDQVVMWATGQPGMAASRIVFRRPGPDGTDLMIVDSDGENLERVGSAPMLFSPQWSPDGRSVVYTASDGARWRIEVLRPGGGTSTLLESNELLMTPAFSADGRRVAYAQPQPGGMRIFATSVASDGGAQRITSGPRDDMSPTFSPDGQRLAFNSSRLGAPHIYVKSADGGSDATLLSPFVYGEPGYYTSPDWAPDGSLVTFHGRSRGGFQIMVADAARPGATVQQITADGVSEDPSWAPDGRHIVFSGYRSGEGSGLYVVDAVTGRLRPLVRRLAELPDWGPLLTN